eukprot:scaffold46058_cov635-Skeletonema_marinoi.AAC.1
MGERGLKGLSSVSSMIGGVVAPRTYEEDDCEGGQNYNNGSNINYAASAPSSSATSLLAAADLDNDEEEELGWDDDDDDDLDF